MTDPNRRDVLKVTATVTLIGLLSPAALAGPVATPAPGKPGEFDFLAGEWKIANKWRQKTTDAWLEFAGEATVHPILNGVGSVEELRIPARDFSGLGLRMFDAEKRTWFDMWSNAKSGAITAPGTPGSMRDGAFIFDATDSEEGKPVIVRGVWDRIVPGRSHSWSQLVSRDGGGSWEGLWLMDWTRA